MGTKMTHAARVELTNEVRKRYWAAAGAEKRKILDEFIAVTGYHQKSAIRALALMTMLGHTLTPRGR